ncbi:4-hydroxybenzoate octaprenyltransferase [Pseudofulvimonas gallinarii]|uniref:4-hydroxybenzoate octaprenyltransferase n=1 Tax=Pseudofulvimonas gallinarii TaxID=634155 RepID=A0A4V2UW93_9GAMM|nr:4-hydroxybenzoate octaprenyltransferase [Pseudofulvimonas gallinarii]TCS98807.1 4-hydroxybenzoate polyprenyltransferase [Pseudofulvimonas gallinarii]
MDNDSHHAMPAGDARSPVPEPSFMREVRAATPQPATKPAPRPEPGRPRAPLTGWRARIDPWWRLARFDRPIGFLLLLWPTWWGLWAAAEGTPPMKLWLIFTLGVISMRAAGCVINDYADRWLDHAVKRTRSRPLAAGELTGGQALAFFAALLILSFVLVLFTNALTIKLAFVGAFLAASYPFLKRYTHLPQIYLGMAFGWSIPMAFAAVLGEVPPLAWLLFCANILWSTAYDTWYAMVDRDDDLRMGAKSTAILLGDMDLVGIALLHGTFLLSMTFAGQQLGLGWPYWASLAVAIARCGHQLWRARHRDRDNCFRAFIDNHWVGMVLFVGLATGLALR